MLATRVGSIRRVVCASPGYLEARGTPATPSDLESHDCITFEGLMSSRSWTFLIKGEPRPVPVRSRLAVNTAEAAVDMAVAGLGMTRVLSYQIASALSDGKIAIVLATFEPPPLPVSLVYTGSGLLPLKLRAFSDFATPRLRAILAANNELLHRT